MTKDYYGTKRITAWPDTGVPSPGGDEELGYAVKYQDGHISWSPKAVFEQAYQPIDAMSFGHAIKAMQDGHRVARAGWNGADMFIFLVTGSTFFADREPFLSILGKGTRFQYQEHIDMRTADGQIIPWNASQADMLANDWMIVGEAIVVANDAPAVDVAEKVVIDDLEGTEDAAEPVAEAAAVSPSLDRLSNTGAGPDTGDEDAGEAVRALPEGGDDPAVDPAEDVEQDKVVGALPPVSVGRIVLVEIHGVPEDESKLPAIVTGVHEDGETVDVTVFRRRASPAYSSNVIPAYRVSEPGASPTGVIWSWPPRV